MVSIRSLGILTISKQTFANFRPGSRKASRLDTVSCRIVNIVKPRYFNNAIKTSRAHLCRPQEMRLGYEGVQWETHP